MAWPISEETHRGQRFTYTYLPGVMVTAFDSKLIPNARISTRDQKRLFFNSVQISAGITIDNLKIENCGLIVFY